MKIVAGVLTVITALALLLAGYVQWKSDAAVTPQGYIVEAAADRADSFNGLVSAYQGGDDSIVSYSIEPIGNVEDYIFMTYTVTVRNADLLSMEWLDMTVDGVDGDVLLVKSPSQDVPPMNQVSFSVTMMTRRGITNYERQARLSYYLYGHYREIPITLG